MKHRVPTILVTSDRWAQNACVVFEDEELIGTVIPDEWVNDRLQHEQDLASSMGGDLEKSIKDVEFEMEDEFERDNDEVENFWPEHMILLVRVDYYYRYDSGGMVWFMGQFDSLNEAI